MLHWTSPSNLWLFVIQNWVYEKKKEIRRKHYLAIIRSVKLLSELVVGDFQPPARHPFHDRL